MNFTTQPVELFIQQLTYLPFDDVISTCQTNSVSRSYCTDPKYNGIWKRLIDNTFSDTFNYNGNLNRIWKDLNVIEGTYNYLVYANLIKYLDTITQAEIYYRQGDMDKFESYPRKFKFLVYFLLGDKDKTIETLPSDRYQPFISVLNGFPVSQRSLDLMLVEMATWGSPKGVQMMLQRGANIHFTNDLALRRAIINLNTLKILIDAGADITVNDNEVIFAYARDGYVYGVQFMLDQGADINEALVGASRGCQLEMMDYLLERGADIHFNDEKPLHSAIMGKCLDGVKYLVKLGANINVYNDDDETALTIAADQGPLEIVKFLVQNGASSVSRIEALISASEGGRLMIYEYLDIIKYLVEQGTDVWSLNSALIGSIEVGNTDIMKYLFDYLIQNYGLDKVRLNDAIVADVENLVWGDLERLKYLIEKREVSSSIMRNALLSAVVSQKLEVVKYLVNFIHDKTILNEALDRARRIGYVDIVNSLIEHLDKK